MMTNRCRRHIHIYYITGIVHTKWQPNSVYECTNRHGDTNRHGYTNHHECTYRPGDTDRHININHQGYHNHHAYTNDYTSLVLSDSH